MRSTFRRGLRNLHRFFSPRARHAAKAVARETLQEGKRVGVMAKNELRREAPRIKHAISEESKRYAENLKRAIEQPAAKKAKKKVRKKKP